jgi:hypothetical protein
LEDVDWLEGRHDHRLPVLADDEVVGACADHGRNVTRRDEGLDLKAGRVEDRPQRRPDRNVVAEGGEVADPLLARAEERQGGRRGRRLEPDREEDHLAVGVLAPDLERVERRVDHPHVGAAGLRLEQRAARARHAHHVAEGGENHLRTLGERDRVVDAAHRDHADRAAGPVHEVDLRRNEVLEPVLVDRVRVPAADLHDLQLAARLNERGKLVRKLLRQLAGAVLVDEPHPSFSIAIPA